MFADNIEDAFGRTSFLLFYLTCGIGAALFYAFLTPASDSPLSQGHSGGVGGILAAYMLLYPRARILILLFMRLPVDFPAVYVLAGWFALQILMLPCSPRATRRWWPGRPMSVALPRASC